MLGENDETIGPGSEEFPKFAEALRWATNYAARVYVSSSRAGGTSPQQVDAGTSWTDALAHQSKRRVAGPIGDRGTGIFNARYGTQAMSHESGTPVFFHPVRYWDRYAMYTDHASLSFWGFHTELTDAYIKRIYWKEGRAVQRAQFRVFARLDDGIGWNASERNLIYRSQLGESSGSGIEGSRASERRRFDRAADKKAFLFVMENGRGDNYIGLQASKIDVRVFAVYRQFAYVWNNPLEIGWKATPVMQEFGIEYLQQNRVRRHIDK